MAIRFTLIASNTDLIFLDPDTDPYTGDDKFIAINENPAVIDGLIGNASYDVGHLFGTFGGGLAGFGVCQPSSKASGVSGTSLYTFVHELGHQFTARHTFNADNAGSCIDNRTEETAYEPGSGTTIMSYVGTCSQQDLQNDEDGSFHTSSFERIIDYITIGNGNTCGTQTDTGNDAPLIDAGAIYTIPAQTAFSLTGSGSDPNGDTLTYSWEQFDLGNPPDTLELPNKDDGSRPIFRSYRPVTSPTRIFPSLINPTLVTKGESLPTTSRTLTFRLTARDNQGGVSYDTTTLAVDNNAGPFLVTVANDGAQIWASGSNQTITWDVANTDQPPVNCQQVNILLSVDGGQTYPYTLASATPNDGQETIEVPPLNQNTLTIKVTCADNVFFASSNSNLTSCSTYWLDNHEKQNYWEELAGAQGQWLRKTDGGYSGNNYWVADGSETGLKSGLSLQSPKLTNISDTLHLNFTHYYTFESVISQGTVQIRINDGGWQLVERDRWLKNGYNGEIDPIFGDTPAFVGSSGPSYLTSVADLSGLLNPGDRFQIRFHLEAPFFFGTETGRWQIDDVVICGGQLLPDLSINKQIDTGTEPVQLGTPVTYTVIMQNNGVISASNVQITDTLPAYLSGANLSKTVTISPYTQITFTLVASVLNTAPYNQLITNTVYFSHTSGQGEATVAFITQDEPTPTPTATATVTPTPTAEDSYIYLPLILKAPPQPMPNCVPDVMRETDDIADSVRICLSQTVIGQVDWDKDNFSNSDRQDVYKISLFEGETVQFTLKGNADAPGRVSLFEPGATTTNGTTTYRTASGVEVIILSFTVDQTGNWYVQVSPDIFVADFITLNYELTVVQAQ